MTFAVPNSGKFQFILPQEERDQIQSGDIMGFSTVYSTTRIIPFTFISCLGTYTIRFAKPVDLLSSLDFWGNEDCREYSLQVLFHGNVHGCLPSLTLIARFMGQHGAHLGPTGPRWAPCWPHELCYLGTFGKSFGLWFNK